jgi:putative hydrolase of HD superfamily
MDTDLNGILNFLKNAEKLKSTLRTAWTADGRQESTAEHTWRLCLMILLFEGKYPDVNFHKLLKICLIHDLGEAISGDISAVDQAKMGSKAGAERNDFVMLIDPLDESQKKEFLALWDEYEAAETKEAKLAKAFDKLETILQHIQGKNPEDFDYAFNLNYGKKYTDFDANTSELRSILDVETRGLC